MFDVQLFDYLWGISEEHINIVLGIVRNYHFFSGAGHMLYFAFDAVDVLWCCFRLVQILEVPDILQEGRTHKLICVLSVTFDLQ